MNDAITPKTVIDFWDALDEEQHFKGSEALDAEIVSRFGKAHEAAREGAYDDWQETPEGTLALVILLDQFARNIHRKSAESYSADDKALAIAKAAVERGDDMALPKEKRQWIYMPYMHSEEMEDQERCIELCKRSGLEETLKWAHVHADIIRRFGRYPHRNAVLGRETTDAEQAFLDDGGFSG